MTRRSAPRFASWATSCARSIRAEAYHVVCRGNNAGRSSGTGTTASRFRDELDRVATKFEWEVYAWCLMPNHHHVVLHATQERLFRRFPATQRQPRAANESPSRPDRTISSGIDRARCRSRAIAHLVGAIALRRPQSCRRQGSSSTPAHGEWSSYRATVGLDAGAAMAPGRQVLALFGRDPASAVGSHSSDSSTPDISWCQTPRRCSLRKQPRPFALTPG